MSEQTRSDFPDRYTRRELNRQYRDIPLTENAFRKLRRYFCAMSDLYGIIPVGKAWEIISSQCPRLVNENEFRAFVQVARHECEGYLILRADEICPTDKPNELMAWEIIDISLLFSETEVDRYEQVKRKQQGKPYYIPEKAFFMSSDADEFSSCKHQLDDMYYFLKSADRRASDEEVNLLTFFLATLARKDEVKLDVAVGLLEENGWQLTTSRQAKRFVELFMDLHSHSRQQGNRGFTPRELAAMQSQKKIYSQVDIGPHLRKMMEDGLIDPMGGVEQEQAPQNMVDAIRNVLSEPAAAKRPHENPSPAAKYPMWPGQKVGRNDPCPCGSGKKYKNCCGR